MSEERKPNDEQEEPEIIFEHVPIEGNEAEILKQLFRELSIIPMGVDGELNFIYWNCRTCIKRPRTYSERCPHDLHAEECAAAYEPEQDVDVKHPWLLELANTADGIRRHHRHQMHYGFDKPRRRTT